MINDFDIMQLPIIDRASYIASYAHAGTLNKHDGTLYMLHVHRVAYLVRQAGGTDVQVAIAWLHDVVEDTVVTMEQIYEWFADELAVAVGVKAITKIEGESLVNYRQRLKANLDAAFVKYFGDTMDNFRRNHLIVDREKAARMAKKYSENFAELAFVVMAPRQSGAPT